MDDTKMIIGSNFDLNDESGAEQTRSDPHGDRILQLMAEAEKVKERKTKKSKKKAKALEKKNRKLQSKNAELKEKLRHEEALAPIRMHAIQSELHLRFLASMLSKGDRERFATLSQGFTDIIPEESE